MLNSTTHLLLDRSLLFTVLLYISSGNSWTLTPRPVLLPMAYKAGHITALLAPTLRNSCIIFIHPHAPLQYFYILAQGTAGLLTPRPVLLPMPLPMAYKAGHIMLYLSPHFVFLVLSTYTLMHLYNTSIY